MTRNVPVTTTALDFVEPPSEVEKREWERMRAEQWAKRTLMGLLAYAEHDRPFAMSLCREVVDKFGPDDELGSFIGNRVRVDRTGKRSGAKITWDYGRYYQLRVHFALLCEPGKSRGTVLEELAEMSGLSGNNAAKKIDERLAKARKEVRDEDLPEFCRPTASRDKGE